jgi:hypothetical protein
MSEVKLTHEELEAMLDRAARRGAKEALTSIGLLDEDAHRDITEMRSLLEVRVTTAATLAFIAGAVWMTFDR